MSRAGTYREPDGRRDLALGLGGLAALIAVMAFVNSVGDRLGSPSRGEEWMFHAVGHVLFAVLVATIGLGAGALTRRRHTDCEADGWSTFACRLAYLIGLASLVEAAGAYPSLDALHIVWAVVAGSLVLALTFIAIAFRGLARIAGTRMRAVSR